MKTVRSSLFNAGGAEESSHNQSPVLGQPQEQTISVFGRNIPKMERLFMTYDTYINVFFGGKCAKLAPLFDAICSSRFRNLRAFPARLPPFVLARLHRPKCTAPLAQTTEKPKLTSPYPAWSFSAYTPLPFHTDETLPPPNKSRLRTALFHGTCRTANSETGYGSSAPEARRC